MTDRQILEAVLTEVKGLGTRMDGFESRMGGIENRMDRIEKRQERFESQSLNRLFTMPYKISFMIFNYCLMWR